MNVYYVEFTVWKRTASFGVCSLLRYACCLMVVLGGMLVTNESHAQTCLTTAFPGDRVVVQNVPEWRNVRNVPHTHNNDPIGKVLNGFEGTVTIDEEGEYKGKYEVRDGKFVWYHVSWDFPERITGWTSGIIDDQLDETKTIKWISTILEAKQKNKIVQALFDGIPHAKTRHDYNDYGCNANWGEKRWYLETGHSGWDVVAMDGAPVPFFSLTAGELLTIPGKGEIDGNNTIAVYDKDKDRTTLYLHAKEILVQPGKNNMVCVGQRLGIQGAKGHNVTGPHLHIEVQKGKSKTPASRNPENGDIYGNETINPIPYLYEWTDDWTSSPEQADVPTAKGGGIASTEKEAQFDMNGDGQVDLFDQLEVLRHLGTDDLRYDLNGDGKVDWEDLREVRDHLTTALLSPAHSTPTPSVDQIRLLANYPNPFNPETWIPYQLAWATDVNISIYAADGALVQTLDLGHQPAGLYLQRNRAAYWDGRNAVGETVASGVYFYTLSVGDFTATRRMMISR